MSSLRRMISVESGEGGVGSEREKETVAPRGVLQVLAASFETCEKHKSARCADRAEDSFESAPFIPPIATIAASHD